MTESDLPAPIPPKGQVLIYRDGALNLQARLDGPTVWLTQATLAELHQTTSQNITLHIKAIYDEGELDEAATCKEYLQVRDQGGRQVQRSLKHYSLDVILAVGYRVRSPRGTLFRQWATARRGAGERSRMSLRQHADARSPASRMDVFGREFVTSSRSNHHFGPHFP